MQLISIEQTSSGESLVLWDTYTETTIVNDDTIVVIVEQ